MRAAALAALLGVAAFSTWRAHQEVLTMQRQYLAADTLDQQQLHAGAQRIDALLTTSSAAALTRYTNAQCQPTSGPSPIHCWTSPQTIDTLAATVTATLTSGGAQHATSHCAPATGICFLRGDLSDVQVRMFLQPVTGPSCHCPTAASNPTARTLVTVYVLPPSLVTKA